MKDGVIADFDIVEIMLKTFIGMVQRKKLFVRRGSSSRVPSGITEVEKRAVRDSVEAPAPARSTWITSPWPPPSASACRSRQPTGNMIIDIGGGTTEIAVISLSGVVNAASVRVAGDEMDDAIINYIKKNYNLIIGEQTSEDIKIAIGSAYPLKEELTMEVGTRPRLRPAQDHQHHQRRNPRGAGATRSTMIVGGLRHALERCPPELSADLVDRGSSWPAAARSCAASTCSSRRRPACR